MNTMESSIQEKATKKDLEESTNSISKQINDLQEEIKKLREDQNKGSTNGTWPTLSATVDQPTPMLATVVRMEITEREQIMSKKLNLIITGIKKSDDDFESVKEVISKGLKIKDVVPEKVLIIGPNEDMLLAEMKNIKDKKIVLQQATNLRKDDDYKTVYVRPDMTPAQRKETKNLSTEIKVLRDKNPGKKYKIYRAKIIELK